MKIEFGLNIQKSQLVMELDKSRRGDKKNANTILKMKPVITIEHFIAPVKTNDAAVIIWDSSKLIAGIIGDWILDHSINSAFSYENYFKFNPKYEVSIVRLLTIDHIMDEHYLYYTFNQYKKL